MRLHEENDEYIFTVEEDETHVVTTLTDKLDMKEYSLAYVKAAPYNHTIESVIESYSNTPLETIAKVYINAYKRG